MKDITETDAHGTPLAEDGPRCIDCKCALTEEEAATFTVCPKCWEKAHGYPRHEPLPLKKTPAPAAGVPTGQSAEMALMAGLKDAYALMEDQPPSEGASPRTDAFRNNSNLHYQAGIGWISSCCPTDLMEDLERESAGLREMEKNINACLDLCSHTIRCCEGGGPEDINGSLALTFMAMTDKIQRLEALAGKEAAGE